MKKPPIAVHRHDDIPDVCETCGQSIDKRSRDSIDHHATPKHLPWRGKRSSRPAWL
jgi:hypothetical protein